MTKSVLTHHAGAEKGNDHPDLLRFRHPVHAGLSASTMPANSLVEGFTEALAGELKPLGIQRHAGGTGPLPHGFRGGFPGAGKRKNRGL